MSSFSGNSLKGFNIIEGLFTSLDPYYSRRVACGNKILLWQAILKISVALIKSLSGFSA